ncbi:MAG TPA: ATP-binding protein [Ignavibacteriales bacterium]|nr:ATP-binding protein [Ignavibacteriales bacterium]
MFKKSSKYFSLKPEQLKWIFNPKERNINIEEISSHDRIVGQERALKALKVGVGLWAQGYNIFISGLSGTGKATTVKKILEEISTKKPVLYDYVYVNNFKDPDRPILITFPAGKAIVFKQDMEATIKYFQDNIAKALQNDTFINKKKKILAEFSDREQILLLEFEKKLEKKGFCLGQIKEGDYTKSDLMPIIDGKPYPIFMLDELVQSGKLTKNDLKSIYDQYNEYQQELQVLYQEGFDISKEYDEKIIELEKETAKKIVNAAIDKLITKYKHDSKIVDYLLSVQDSVLENLDIFKKNHKYMNTDNEEEDFEASDIIDYKVNIILDNSDTKSCPVIIEAFPTYNNLFGTIEKYPDTKNAPEIDFTRIKAGSLLRANGGYLVLNAQDIFEEPHIWKNLKRVLLHGKLEIHDLFGGVFSSPSSLKPESIDINLKVILIGNQYSYWLLSNYEDDFKKIFKIKAEFDTDYKIKDTENLVEYIAAIKNLIKKENLLSFKDKAIARVLEYSARYVGRKDKLTLRFSYITDLLREANFWATEEKSKTVDVKHIDKAYDSMIERHSLYDDLVIELFEEGQYLIDTQGEKVGQINGLTIYESDIYSFGKPTRITATISAGDGKINIVEREVGLAGKTFNKAAMIISGFIKNKFAKEEKLKIDANIVFEQAYSHIDGDSASAAEICVLLSAIGEIPLKQNIAITGSVNQKGEIQPIGGVNEKIEGFYQICKVKGLKGNEGVIIPKLNVNDLMLKNEIVEAVKNKKFSIYAIENIDEAIEILTGIKAGKIGRDNMYERGTFYSIVEKKLKKITKLLEEKNDNKSKK